MSAEELQWRCLIVFASGLIYWGGVWVQARRIRKRIGHSPNLRPRGPKERALWLGWLVVIVVWLGQPWLVGAMTTRPALAFIRPLLLPVVFGLGSALLMLGYAGTLWAYAAMGDTWRIGVNVKDKTALVRGGPFRWVRHPIYLFQVVMLAGVALLLPTPVSFAVLALHYVCAIIKARDEEQHLSDVHGPAYRDYLSRTGSLFPRWMRK
jgi:protein-S-isoprenylcysteine O-methyltransferase Ste14